MKNEVNNNDEAKLKSSAALQEPSLYYVVVYHDDYTPLEFVVAVLEKFFFMNRRKVVDILLEAQKSGKALCGVFSRDFAEKKVSQVAEYAKLHEHPLICSMEAA